MRTKIEFRLSRSDVKLYMSYITSLIEEYGIIREHREISVLKTEEDYYYYICYMFKEIVNYVEILVEREKTDTIYLELEKDYEDICRNFASFMKRTRCK